MPRSNQTKQLLAQSLQELMATTPLERISVNDIVDHANVGRNTFYYHFEDKYDLVNWYFQSGITRFLVELSAYPAGMPCWRRWRPIFWKTRCSTAMPFPITGRTACSNICSIICAPSLSRTCGS